MLNYKKRIIFITMLLFLINYIIIPKNQVRIKDVSIIEGVRENQLMGFGLVVGLQGRGDTKNFKLTGIMLQNLTANYGFNVTEDDVKSKNVATVLVTSNVGPFARTDDLIDISISSIGDAKSLEGGILLQTSLKGADGIIYAVAQGRILAGNKSQNAETTASIPDGAIIERNISTNFISDDKINIILKYPDFVTASQIVETIKSINSNLTIQAIDAGLVEISLTEEEKKNPVDFIAKLEVLTITPDYVSTVVIDKKTGLIVVGEDIVIQDCSITTPYVQVKVGSSTKKQNIEIKGQTVGELVKLLNETGLNNNEIISLIESIHKIGAINSRLILL